MVTKEGLEPPSRHWLLNFLKKSLFQTGQALCHPPMAVTHRYRNRGRGGCQQWGWRRGRSARFGDVSACVKGRQSDGADCGRPEDHNACTSEIFRPCPESLGCRVGLAITYFSRACIVSRNVHRHGFILRRQPRRLRRQSGCPGPPNGLLFPMAPIA